MLPVFKEKGAPKRAPETIEVVTLDEVWREAERLGRIEVERPIGARHTYRVRIMFERRTGSTVWAEGNNPDILQAMIAAIREAEILNR